MYRCCILPTGHNIYLLIYLFFFFFAKYINLIVDVNKLHILKMLLAENTSFECAQSHGLEGLNALLTF